MTAGSAAAGSNSITPFFGMFKEESVIDPRGLLTAKDIDVAIWQPHQKFAINSHSVVENEATKRANHEVHFCMLINMNALIPQVSIAPTRHHGKRPFTGPGTRSMGVPTIGLG